MPRLTMQHPIRAFDNPLLFNPDTLLTEETLDAVINSQRAYSCQTHPLLSYGSVKEDFLNFLMAEDLMPDDQECIQLFATENNTDIIWGKSNDEKSDDQNF